MNGKKQNFNQFIMKFNRTWIDSVFIVITLIWFPVLKDILGEKIYFKNPQGEETTFFYIMTFIIYIGVIFLKVMYERAVKCADTDKQDLIKSYEIKIEEINSKLESENKYSVMLSKTNDNHVKIYNEKYSSMSEVLISKIRKIALEINYDVNKQIKLVINEILQLTSDITHINSDRVSVSLFYKFEDDNDWILYKKKCKNDLTSNDDELGDWALFEKNYYYDYKNKEIIHLRNSFAQTLLKQPEPFLLCNDKEAAAARGEYALNERDKNCKKNKECYGSIIGHKLNITEGQNKYINAMLFISIYGVKFDNDDDSTKLKEIEKNFERVILPQYIIALKTELIQLYLEILNSIDS